MRVPSTPMLVELDEDRHWWFATRTRAILAFLDRYISRRGNQRILDVGCGAANMAHHLRHYGQVEGVDNSPRPLEVARKRGLQVHEGAAESLPFGENEFDLLALLDTVEHVIAEEEVFQECWRVLREPDSVSGKQGGKLLITVPAFMALWSHNDDINRHQRRYTASELQTKLARNGFKTVRISYNNFFIFPLAVLLILLRRRWAEPDLASPHSDHDAYQVEMEPAPPLLNTLLTEIGKLEVAILRVLNFPLGTSIIAIAEKVKPK